MPRGIGPSAGTNPRPLYVNMLRGLWKPFVLGWALWVPMLGVLLYFKIARGMPTPWYIAALIGLILLAMIPSALIFPVWIVRLQRHVVAANGRICPNCLYDLRALDDDAVCPECGWDIAAEPPEETWAKLINRGKPLPPPTDAEPRTSNEPRPGGSGPDSPGHA